MDQTYKIIGGDGQEYGPVSLPELKEWIVDGRIAARTQVWSSRSENWNPAVYYGELHPEIGQIAELSQQNDVAAQRVGFWPRAGAYLIDAIVLNLLFYVVLGPSNFVMPPPGADGLPDVDALWQAIGPRVGWETLLAMTYTVACTGQMGATVGKLVIGARIIRIDGSRLGLGKAFQRWLGTVLSGFTLGIGYLLVAFRADKRALHDLLAGTQVVYRR